MAESASGQLPTISVIMPVYNEAAFIERSLGAMLAQDYPAELVEVLVVDGMSDDGTCEIVGRMAAVDPRVRLVDNPQRIIPAALNVGLALAQHEITARMDGHTLAPPDYLRRCAEVMRQSGADCVGGRVEYAGETLVSRAIAAAMDSQFGVGTSRWRGATTAGEADTVPYGFMQRERALALDGYDESLLVNEDYEFNFRLRRDGWRIWYSPDIQTTYYVRPNLRALVRQYTRYGLWKARMLRLHPGSVQLRHLLAPLFVLGIVGGALLLPLGAVWRWTYGVALGLYALLALAFGVRQAARHGWRLLPLIPPIFLVLHLAWGSGFLAGVWRWWVRGEVQRERGK